MRLPTLLLLIALSPAPLPAASEDDVALAVQVLSALRRGDAAALEAMPIESALAPPDLPDPAEPGLRRRWSLALPALVAGLDPAARARALAALDRRAQAALALAGPGGALDALPSPAALAELGRAADRAFDRGRFAEAELLWRLVAGAGGADPGPRRALAARLAGEADPAEPELPPPGTLAPLEAPPAPVPAAGGARAEGPWLVARDPWDRPLWRRPIDGVDETVVTGGGWSLVQGQGGLQAVDPAGLARTLRPPPRRTRVRAVAAGVAWFVRPGPAWMRGRAGGDPADAWRYRLAEGAAEELALPEEPLGAPLVRGRQALWLGRLHLWLSDGARVAAVAVHGQALSAVAQLRWQGGRALVVDGDRAWAVAGAPAAPGGHPAWAGGDPGDERRAPEARLHRLAAAAPAPGLERTSARRDGDWLEVSLRCGGALRWVRRWAALPLDQAPAQQAVAMDGRVLVVEGGHHLTQLAAADGALTGWGCIAGAEVDPSLAVAWAPRCAAAVVPGRRDRLLLTVEGRERSEPLPGPAIGLAAAGGSVEVELEDGARMRIPCQR